MTTNQITVMDDPKTAGQRLYSLAVLRKDTAKLPDGQSYAIYVLDQEAKIAEGLAYLSQEELGRNTGMLCHLVTETSSGSLSMKNVQFDVDFVFMDELGKILAVESVPRSATKVPKHKARFVLEVPTGEAARLRLAVGQRLVLPSDLVDASPEAPLVPAEPKAGSTSSTP
jgi:uncharacterized membrane protein (UPF0127 family)